MTPKRIVILVLVLVLVGFAALFTWTNHATSVNVLFKLTPGLAWDLGPDGISLPLLLGISFLAGAVLAGIVGSFSLFDSSRRVRTLSRQVTALQDEIEFNKRTDSPKPAAVTPPSNDLDDLI
jgi:hypothetical protein